MSETSTDQLIAVLHASQERLRAALEGLDDEQVRRQSYDDDWSVAQVASHLGSSAELFTLFVDAGAKGEPVPGAEVMQPVWDTWNAKDPLAQARDSLAVNDAFLARVDALDESERDTWRLDLFGAVRDLPEFLRMRLSEHAVHTWDIVVAFDPAATVAADAATYVVDNLAMVAGWTGKQNDEQVSVEVRTTDPRACLPPRPRSGRGRAGPVIGRHRGRR
jgi:uncharacterized protein (TIGR03083 family)